MWFIYSLDTTRVFKFDKIEIRYLKIFVCFVVENFFVEIDTKMNETQIFLPTAKILSKFSANRVLILEILPCWVFEQI